jgi:hypothetical protein
MGAPNVLTGRYDGTSQGRALQRIGPAIATDHNGMITFWNTRAAINLAAVTGVRESPHHRIDRSAMAS